MTSNKCKGCKSNEPLPNRGYPCDHITNKDKCPCAICLIKMVCEAACKEYMIHRQYNRVSHLKKVNTL